MSPAATAILRLVGAFLLCAAFMVHLMTAIAQQSALARLTQDGVQTGYSSAYAMLRDVERRRRELPIMVGALIAVCVYIVLLGGTAVLLVLQAASARRERTT